jgi:LacI family transcriptional regulator
MIDKGFKTFAHVATPLNLNNIRERHEGFVQCIKDNDLQFDKRLLKICNYDPLQAHNAVKCLIENFKVDAVFTSSDKITIDTCRALNDLMPNDNIITQFGFTNLSTADLISPPIISIKQPAFELGATTAEVLLHNIESAEYENWKTEDIIIN